MDMSYYDESTCEVSQSIDEPYNTCPEIDGASEERQMRTSFSRQARSVKSKQARHASVDSLKLALTTGKRQYSYKTLFFLSLALVLVTVAFTRIASRLSLLTTHFTPLKLPSGLTSTRNITSMSMASAKYQKPPQAPPSLPRHHRVSRQRHPPSARPVSPHPRPDRQGRHIRVGKLPQCRPAHGSR